MRYVLGIDQGGSKTYAVITDDCGKIYGFGKSSGTCTLDGSLASKMVLIEQAVSMALTESGLTINEIHCIAAGLNGIDWKEEEEQATTVLKERFSVNHVYAVNDCIIAMRAGCTGDVSSVICVGSGTNCAVRNKDDLFIYGFYIPDEYQGGWSLGKKAVQAVLDAEMGFTEKTILKKMVLDYFKIDKVDDLLYKRSTIGITDNQYLGLPIILERAALEGDKIALEIWEDFGKHLARFVTARMKIMGIQEKKIEVVLSGSIFKCKIPQFIEIVREEILKLAPKAEVKSAVYEPIVGATLLGLDKLYNKPLPQCVYDNLEKSAEYYKIKR